MRIALAIALAGALGSLARYGVGRLTLSLWGEGFPWGTLTVNVLGSFLLAFVLTASLHNHGFLPETLRVAMTTGFLGAFTTFSTFSYESLSMVERGPQWMVFNLLANLLVGLSAGALGIFLATKLWAQS